MTARKWILAKQFEGLPKLEDFKLVEEDLPELKDGDILLEAEFLSVDPYMRVFAKTMTKGSTHFFGGQIAKVTESKNPNFPVGSYVSAYSGWRDKTVQTKAELETKGLFNTTLVPDVGDCPRSLALGALGMPGATAYLGLMKICKPQDGEVVLVNTAAGAVGSLVGQIAKIKGCKVIGYTGSDDKVKYLKEELGFDAAFNYKTCDIDETLKEAAPDGVDCYFDNVGGDFSHTVVSKHMKLGGRIAICGQMDSLNNKEGQENIGTYVFNDILLKQLTIEGFNVFKWLAEWEQATTAIQNWIQQGRIKCKEQVVCGFDKMPEAFLTLLTGKNIGKVVVKA